jgi:hypothetical protein
MENSAEMYRRFRHLEARTKPVLPYFDVKYYGAKGDGVTDDTAAIQAAVTAWMAQGYGELKFPQGRYIITDSIIFEPPTPGMMHDKPKVISGSGATIYTNVTGVPGFWFRGPSATKTYFSNWKMRDLNLYSQYGTPTDVILVDDNLTYRVNNCQFYLDNVRVTEFPLASNGITFIDAFEFSMKDCYVRMQVPTIGGTAPTGNCVNFLDNSALPDDNFSSSVSIYNLNTAFGLNGVYMRNLMGFTFTGGLFSGAWNQGVRGELVHYLKMIQPHFENDWRGGTPPGTNGGGYRKAGIYILGGSVDIDITDIDLTTIEYGFEGFPTGRSFFQCHKEEPQSRTGKVLALYDYGSPDIAVDILGISPDDVSFISSTMPSKTKFVGVVSSMVVSQATTGSELVVNGNFAAWTGDNPDGWTLDGAEDANNYVTQSPTGKAKIVMDATGGVFRAIKQTSILTTGKWYAASLVVSNYVSGQYCIFDPIGGYITNFNSAGTATGTFCAGCSEFWIFKSAPTGGEMSIDDVSCKELTLATLFRYPLPATIPYVKVSTNLDFRDNYSHAGLVLNVNDTANPTDFILCYFDKLNSKIHLTEYVSGVRAADAINETATYVVGATLMLIKDKDNKCRVYYNGVQIGTEQTMTTNINTNHGVFSTSSSNILSKVEIVPNG